MRVQGTWARPGWRILTTVTSTLALLLAAAGISGAAVGSGPRAVHAQSPASDVRQACSAPTLPGRMACLALVRTGLQAGGQLLRLRSASYGPADLQAAYGLTVASAARGDGETVAVVDAYDDPNAAADLATYRKRWGLPACDQHTGAGCVTKVNQKGQASSLPGTDPSGGWEVEESLDIDMVAAICPRCHILLVEANLPLIQDLGPAENTAVRLGARFVSNSWGGGGLPSDTSYFNHPGAAITAAAGDLVGITLFPASSQLVTSVGGTTLTHAAGSSRGWQEMVWGGNRAGTGGGCTLDPIVNAQPSWQQAFSRIREGCPNRVMNDVAAVADPATPVWAYDTYPVAGGSSPGWIGVGGTSVSSPIIASVYALAGGLRPGSYPASYLYQRGHAADFNDITTGSNGTCSPAFLCHASPGYDGPSGWGTPRGTSAFADTAAADTVTVIDPGTRDYSAGTMIRLPVHAAATASGRQLRYTAVGLPAGLSISTSTGMISGRLPSASGTSTVTVTVADGSDARGRAVFHIVAVPDLRSAYHPVIGPVQLHLGLPGPVRCLDDAHGSSHNGTRVQIWFCDGRAASQDWKFVPDAGPDGSGTLMIHGRCLEIAGNGLADHSKVQLWRCTGEADEKWSLSAGAAWLFNPASDMCLNDPAGSSRAGTRVEISVCGGVFRQLFTLPPGPVLSAVARMCMTDPGNSVVSGTRIQARPCNGDDSQKWDYFSNDSAHPDRGGLVPCTISARIGAPVEMLKSPQCVNGLWFLELNGEIINVDAGLCLDNPSHGTGRIAGLVLADCSGQLGEIWAIG